MLDNFDVGERSEPRLGPVRFYGLSRLQMVRAGSLLHALARSGD
jgi:hypothetical protein